MTNISVRISTNQPTQSTSFTPGTVPYLHKEDKAIRGYIRSCAPCPAVWILHNDSHVYLTKQWQYYLLAINMSMTVENVYFLLDDHLAFANNTGFIGLSNPGRKDYFYDRTDFDKFPQFDKVRTCSRSCLTGVEVYNVVQALRRAINELRLPNRSLLGVRAALTTTNTLRVKTFDSRANPPLKPGRTYPQRIDDINLDDYLYTPQHNREMFLVATIVNARGDVVQFPRGGLYSWTNDATPYSFLPHISNPTYGRVDVPLDNLIRLPKDAPVPSPYRRTD